MTTTMVIIALMVLFGALLIGKMLTEMLPESGTGTDQETAEESRTPAE
ncbi:hypothetical protein [Roseovarius salis]